MTRLYLAAPYAMVGSGLLWCWAFAILEIRDALRERNRRR